MKRLKPSAKPAESALNLPLRAKAVAFAVASALSPALQAQNLPTGLQTTNGSVTVTNPTATSMALIQSTQNAGMTAQMFGIGSGNRVDVIQPNSSSVMVMNVLGGTKSSIFGTLTANGHFFLINPAGVMFAPGASVDVGGLVATTMPMTYADAISGRYVFTNNGSSGSVEVQKGATITALNGYVGLFAPKVINEGLIVARMGSVALAAGNQVTLDMVGDGLIKVTVNEAALNASVMNKGTIEANGGNVLLSARSANALLDTVINTDGIIRANTIANRNGTIVLDGGDRGVVSVAGQLEAKGIDAGTTGGTVKVLGQYVGVALPGTTASIDASGDAGGGTVLLGGNFQGKGPEANAFRTFVGADATINADAVTTGNGGKVIVWADDATRFYGNISARGGAQRGDGGFVEVSGKAALDFRGQVDTLAPNGATGTLLLDPTEITITNGANQTAPQLIADGITVTGTFTDTATTPASGGTLTDGTINTQLMSNNVTVAATGVGGDGNIIVNGTAAILNGSGLSRTLTLQANKNIDVQAGASISGAGGGNALSVILNSNRSNTGGAISITGASITTFGGSISLVGGSLGNGAATSLTNSVAGVSLTGATLDAGAGAVTITGQGSSGIGPNNIGVNIGAASSITGNAGITITGTGGGTGSSAHGVLLAGSSSITSDNGAIGVTGNASATGSGGDGVRMTTGAKVQGTTTAAVNVGGTGKNGTGVFLVDSSTAITAIGGDLGVTGTGNGVSGNYGVAVLGGAQINNGVGAGKVTVNGTVNATGAGTGNVGVVVSGTGSSIGSLSGDLSVTGTGASGTSGNGNHGVQVLLDGRIGSSSGLVTVTGFGGNGTGDGNHGVYVLGPTSEISSVSGNVIVTGTGGTGGPTSGDGVRIEADGSIVTAGSGSITITGTAGGPAPFGIHTLGGTLNRIGGNTHAGAVTLIADSMSLDTVAIRSTADVVTLRQKTAGLAIDLGGTEGVGKLFLSDAELDAVNAPTLRIGNASSGNINVSSAISTAGGISTLDLQTNGTITQAGVVGTITAPTLSLSTTGGNAELYTAINAVTNLGTVSLGTGEFLLVNTGNLTVTGAVGATGGVTIETAGTLAVNNTINAGSNTASLKTTGSGNTITQAASSEITAGNLNLTTTNASATLNGSTNVVSNLGAVTLGTGALNLLNTGNLTVQGEVVAKGGVTINTAGTLALDNTIDAVFGTASLTTTGSGNAITQAPTGGIVAVTLTLATDNASATLNGSSNNVSNLGAVTLGSGALNLLNTGNLTVTGAVGATGGVTINTAGTLDLNNTINGGTNTVSLTTTGTGNAITQVSGSITAGTLTLATDDASATLSSATNAVSNLGTVTLGTGSLDLLNTGNLTVTGVVGATGVTIDTVGALAVNNTINTGGGNLNLTATTGITQNATGILTVGATTNLVAGAGVITLDQANDFASQVNASNTGANEIQITNTTDFSVGTITSSNKVTLVSTGGSILDSGGGLVTGSYVHLSAPNGAIGAGAGNEVFVNTAQLELRANGGVDVSSAQTLTFLDLTLNPGGFTGNYGITDGGGTPNTYSLSSDGTNLLVTAIQRGGLNNLTVGVRATTGNLSVAELGIQTGSGNVSLQSDLGNILDSTPLSDTNANVTTTGTVTLIAPAGSIGAGADPADFDLAGASNVVLVAGNGAFVSSNVSPANLTLVLDPATQDVNYQFSSTDGTTVNITETGNTVVNINQISSGTANFDVNITAITTSSGGIDIGIPGINLTGAGSDVTLTSTLGSITGGGLVKATGLLTLSAGEGIGASGSPLKTQVSTVNFGGTPTGIFLNNTGALTVSGPAVVTTGGGIHISANSPLTISTNQADNAGGDLEFAALGSLATDVLTISADLTTSGGAGTGKIQLWAGSDILHTTGNISSTGGAIDFFAGVNRVTAPPAVATPIAGFANSVVNQTGGTVSSTSGNITIRATGDVTAKSVGTTSGKVTLGADASFSDLSLTLSDGTGTLFLPTTASVSSSNAGVDAITLQGADIDINATAGTINATGPGGIRLFTSLGTQTMGISGGAGAFNVSDAELLHLGTHNHLTIGESGVQSGVITIQTLIGGSALTVNANGAGAGGKGIVLDDGGVLAAIGNGSGAVNLNAGSGGITAANALNGIAEISTTGVVTLNTSGTVGTAASPIEFAGVPSSVVVGNVTAPSAGGSEVSLRALATGFTTGAITTTNRPVTITNTGTTDTITVAGPISTGTGAISISSTGSLAINNTITTTGAGGTIAINANTVGADADGFTQGAFLISSGDTGPNAVRITVNDTAGATGTAQLDNITVAAGGNITVTTRGQAGTTTTGGNITQTTGAVLTATTGTVTLATGDTASIGTAQTSAGNVNTTAATVVASAGSGGLFLEETNGASFTVNALLGGAVNVLNDAGTLTIAGASGTATGPITLASQGPIAVNNTLTTTGAGGTIAINANTVGADADGFTQGAFLISSGDTGPNAVRITVNDTAGATGTAQLDNITVAAGGNITVTTRGQAGTTTTGGNITQTTGAVLTATTGTVTLATGDTASIGTAQTSAGNVNTTAATVVASAGSGGLFLEETNGASFTVNALLGGAVNVLNDAGTLTIAGASGTATGPITLASQGPIAVNNTLTTTGAGGTIAINANTVGADADGFTQGAFLISSGDTGPNAVRITVNDTAGATGTAQLDNITVAAGGNITVTTRGQAGTTTTGGNITQTTGAVLTATTGTVTLATGDTASIGTAQTSAGNVNTTAATVVASAGSGGLFLEETNGASFTVNALLGGAVNVLNDAGTLTIAGASGTATGPITLASQGPIAVNNTLTTTGAGGTIAINANTVGADADGFTQGAFLISSGDTGPNAVRITVNDTAGATGTAQLDNITVAAGGNITVTTRGQAGTTTTGGNITQTTGAVLTATTGTVTLATGDTASIGTAQTSAGNVNTTAATVVASAGSGGLFLEETNGASFTVNALLGGAVNVLNDAGTLTIAGASGTATGPITLASQGPIAVNNTLTTTGAGGTIAINANTVGADADGFTQGAFLISSGDTGPNAVRITVNDTAGATGTAQLDNITVAAGGNITVTTRGQAGTTTTGGNITQTTGAVLTATTGTVTLATGDTASIGTAQTSAGNVNTTAATINATGGSGGIFIAEADGATLNSVTTSGNGPIDILSTTGNLLVGTVNAGSGGNVTLTSTAGSILNDGNTATRITGNLVTLTASTAANSIGTAGANNAIDTDATTIVATSGTGGTFINELNGVALGAQTTTGDYSLTAGGTITTTGALNVDGNLTLAATGENDVIISNTITHNNAAAGALLLRAGRDVIFNSAAGVTGTGGGIYAVTLNADANPNTNSSGAIALGSGTIINSAGGAITLGGGSGAAAAAFGNSANGNVAGVTLNNAQLLSGAGAITVRGTGLAGTSNAQGISLVGGSVIEATGVGNISLTGTGGGTGGGASNAGVSISGAGSRVTSTGAGTVTILGTGGAANGGTNVGVDVVAGGKVQSTGAGGGTIGVTGTGGAGSGASDIGVRVSGAGSQIVSADGAITVQGTGGTGTTSGLDSGVMVSSGGEIRSTGVATIGVTGFGGASVQNNRGVYLDGGVITSVTGAITVAGTGAGSGFSNFGVDLSNSSKIESTGAAPISVTGTGTTGNPDVIMTFGTNTIGGASATGNITLNGLSQGIQLGFGGGDSAVVQTAGNVTLNSVGGSTQNSGGITAAGLGLLGTGGTHNLTAGANTVSTLAGDTGTVKFVNTAALDVGAVNSTTGVKGSTVKLKTVTGGLSVNQPINTGAAGTVTLQAVAGNVVGTSPGVITAGTLGVNGLAVDIGSGVTNQVTTGGTVAIRASGGNLIFRNANGYVIGTVAADAPVFTTQVDGLSANNDMTLRTDAGTVTQASGKTVTAVGLELLGAGAYTLTDAGNAVTRIAANTGGAINYVNTGALEVGQVNSTVGITTSADNVTLQTGGATAITINESIAVGAANLTLNAGGGTTTQAAGKNIAAAGLELLGAGAYTLTEATNAVTTIAANTGGAISYRDTDGLIVGTVNTVGITTSNDNVTLQAGGALALSNAVNAGTGNVSLTSTTDSVSGAGLVTATDLVVQAVTGIGLTTAVSRLNANNTTSGDIVVSNSGGTLTLDDFSIGNGFGVRNAGGNVSVTNAGSISIPGTNISNTGVVALGNVVLTANGAAADIQTGGGNASDVLVAAGGNITLTAGRDILLGSASGWGDVLALGNLDLSAGRHIVVDGFTYVEAGSNDYGTTTNAAGTITATAAGDISVTQVFNTRSHFRTYGGGITLTTGSTGASGTFTVDTGMLPIFPAVGSQGGNIVINAGTIVLNDFIDAGGGNVVATAAATTITGTGTVIGNNVTLDSATGVGANAGSRLNVTATTLAARSGGAGGVFISETDGVTIGTIGAVSNAAGTAGYDVTVAGAIAINGPITSAGDVTLTTTGAGNAITQGASSAITGNTLILTTTDANATLNGSTNLLTNLGTTTLGSGALNLLDAGGLTVTGAVGATGGVTLETSGPLAVNNTITTAGGNIALTTTGAGNAITFNESITAGAGNVTLNAAGGTTTQALGKTITAAGLELQGAGSYTLTDTANSVPTIAGNTTGTVKFVNAGALDVGTVTTAGLTSAADVTLNAQTGNLTVSDVITAAGTVRLQSETGNVTQSAVITAATLGVNAGLGIDLSTVNNQVTNGGTVAMKAASGDLKFTNANGYSIGSVGADTIFTAISGLSATGNITLNTAAGTVLQTQPITAAGLELLGAGAYTLTNASNNVTTLAANTTNAISYTDADDLTIGTVGGTTNFASTNGGVTLIAVGTLTPTDVNSGTGVMTLTANSIGGGIIRGTAASGTVLTLNSQVAVTGLDVQFPNVVAGSAHIQINGSAGPWQMTGSPNLNFPAIYNPPTFTPTDLRGTMNTVSVLFIDGAADAAAAAAAASAAAAAADASDVFGTDSVAQIIEYGFAGDVGTLPPIDHRLQGVGISVPICFNESREGDACSSPEQKKP